MSVTSSMDSSTTATSKSPNTSSNAALSPTSVVVAAAEGMSTSSSSNSDDVTISASLPIGGACSSNDSHGYDGDNDEVRSPTSVTMVCSSSSASLLPTAAATVVPGKPNKAAAVMPKPFFVMDWLEEINPRDLELARQMLNTPTKNKGQPGRSKSTPLLGSSNSSAPSSSLHHNEQPQQARSSINLPTLSHKEEDSICRQLYSSTPATPTASDNKKEVEDPETAGSSVSNMSRATSSTSVSTTGSSVTPDEAKTSQPTASVVKMSPFKKRSIAIGNGWNAKGLHKAKKGSWESALACWENALEIRTQVLGETHPDVANTCNNIGIALGKLGRFDAAIETLERALELRAKYHGTREHAEVAATLHNIGNVLHAAQDSAGAIQCFWDAKMLQEKLLGPDHVQVARACVAIANVYYEAQQYEDAREAYYDALQIFANAGLPQSDPEIKAIQDDLQAIQAVCHSQHQQYTHFHPAVAAHQQLMNLHYHRGFPQAHGQMPLFPSP